MKKALIIGGGFAGCAMSHQLGLTKGMPWDVTILEAGPVIGAGVRTQWIGGHPYTYGPRHFLTQNKDVYQYMNTFCPLRLHPDHEFLTYVEYDKQFYNYPIHIDDIDRMHNDDQLAICAELDEITDRRNGMRAPVPPPKNFEEFWLQEVGSTLYLKYINTYSKKMWGISANTQLSSFDWSPKGTTIKRGPRAGWDTAISGYPVAPNGYNDYFDIATLNAKVHLNSRWSGKHLNNVAKDYDLIVSTIAPDTLFDYNFGRLPFMGRDITTLVLPVEFALPEHVYFCYYASAEPYTRVTEYKKFTQHKDKTSTLITIEYPSQNGRLYPLPTDPAQKLAKRYLDRLPKNVKSIGRAGSYDYRIDIDDCILQAMTIAQEL